jgi:ppGpp synthetase/RelA/SpoT-type nucleotidyltranferase
MISSVNSVTDRVKMMESIVDHVITENAKTNEKLLYNIKASI